jgi:signal recognition particle receptor subunit beta
MVLFNYSTKELTAKVVYYGPGLCGKTTNLQWIHEKLPIKNKGKMLSLATETDRTLFFDFLPIELGTIRGMRTRIQLYTVPGQVFYNATRRMVLKGADCVVFVADSQEPMLDANVESLENLRQNLEANEIDPDEIPSVIQYNKRDLPNALPLEIMNARLNPRGRQFFEAVAIKGHGVEETLKGVTTLVFRSLASKYGGEGSHPSSGTTAPRSLKSGTAPRIPLPDVTPATPVTASTPPATRVPPVPAAAPPAPSPPPASRAAPVMPPASVRPPEPAPARAASPDRVNGGSRDTIPPAPFESDDDYDEDLLDSLHISPTGDADELWDAEPASEPEEQLEVVEEPAPMGPGRVGIETVASTPQEAEVLRRRIARPLTELDLERMEQEEQEVEEITLEDELTDLDTVADYESPLETDLLGESAPLDERAPLAAARSAPGVAAPPPPPFEPPPAPPAPTFAPPPLPPMTAVAPASIPVSVDLVAGPAQAEVAIPVEIVLNNGTAQVNLHVRLTLNLRLKP